MDTQILKSFCHPKDAMVEVAGDTPKVKLFFRKRMDYASDTPAKVIEKFEFPIAYTRARFSILHRSVAIFASFSLL